MIDKKEYIKEIVESWIDEDIKELTDFGLVYDTHFETGELITLITKIAIDISPFIDYISECFLSYASKRPEYNKKYINYLKKISILYWKETIIYSETLFIVIIHLAKKH